MFDRESNEDCPSSETVSRRSVLRGGASLTILIGAGDLTALKRHELIRFGYGGKLITTDSGSTLPDSGERDRVQNYGEYGYGGTKIERGSDR